MLNIEIHGFGSLHGIHDVHFLERMDELAKLQTAITEILMGFPFAHEAAITTCNTERKYLDQKPAPFLRICDTDHDRADKIARALVPLKIDIEILRLYVFYPAATEPT